MAASVIGLAWLACGVPGQAQTLNRPQHTITNPPAWSGPAIVPASGPILEPPPSPPIAQVSWRESTPSTPATSAPRDASPYHVTGWSPKSSAAPPAPPVLWPTSSVPQRAPASPPKTLALEGPPLLPMPEPLPKSALPPKLPVVRPAKPNLQVPLQHPNDIKLATDKYRVKPDDITEQRFHGDLPGLQRFTQLQSEEMLKQRMIQEARRRGERLEFPEDPPPPKQVIVARRWPPLREVAEPSFVMHGRLFFEQPAFERYGWDLGIIQPVVSAGLFYWDAFTLPYNWGTHPFQRYESSAGHCLPGDPVPLLLPPPEIRVSGLVAQTSALFGVFLAFP
jgi:hypothetical protein